MKQFESLQDFYDDKPWLKSLDFGSTSSKAGHFNVFKRDSCAVITPYSRRDFYKISFILGKGKIHYADRWISIDKPALFFSNPLVPYSWEAESAVQEGWFCLFTEDFVQSSDRNGLLQESNLFNIGSEPVFFVDAKQQEEIASIFCKMQAEIVSDYPHKYSLLLSYLQLIIHQGIKMRPADNSEKNNNASSRITALFVELLERQFPIDTPEAGLKLKTANDYARSLSIHANHLNRIIKDATGKTTTAHIAARVTQEARALLQHTDWNVAKIAYSLGFETPAYFNNFFKKNTGTTPREARNRIV
jgi:AraC family transcriptional activator of pobA